jgi:uncharacterized protein
MLLALLSDTHDNAAGTRAALGLLARHKPAAYLHAGDLVEAGMLVHFAGIGAFHFVFGNNEYDHAGLRSQALALGLMCHGEFGDLTFANKRVALLHGHDSGRFERVVRSGEYHYVIHGHSHVPRDVRVGAGGTRIINPGALNRAKVKTVALLDVVADEVEFLEVG